MAETPQVEVEMGETHKVENGQNRDRLRSRLESAGVSLGEDGKGHLETTFMSGKERLVQNQQLLLVLVFSQSGESEYKDMRRDDVLKLARNGIPPIREDDPRVLEEKRFLQTLRTKLPEKLRDFVDTDQGVADRVRLKGTLQPRDLRLLDSSFIYSKEPAILVRRHSILVNLWPIKALLLHDRTLIFVPDGADSMLSTLLTHLRERVDVDNPDYREMEVSFVLRSLEAIFITTSLSLDTEVEGLIPKVAQRIKEVMTTSSGVTIELLRQTKYQVDEAQGKLSSIQQAFDELLANDRDMALMKLDKVYTVPDFYDERNCETWEIDHEEVELLLENYAQSIDGTVAKVKNTLGEIDSAMSAIALRLDTARNKLLGVDLLVNSVTSVAAMGALFAGLFGMNLSSGVEDAPNWFWAWFGAIVGGVPVLVVILFYIIYKKGLLIT